MHRVRGKLTYSNVISTLCLVLLVGGGTAYAAKQMVPKNSVGTKQIKNNAITGAKIANGAITGAKIAPGSVTGSDISSGSLGTVPSASQAANATHATTADNAGHAATAESATHATNADSATHATTADSANGLAAPEPVNFVTHLENGFVNYEEGYERAGYYRDRQCVVHLQGVVAGEEGTAFTLPPGFRPAESTFAAIPASTELGTIFVQSDGEVELDGASGSKNWGLSGITFRVAGC